MQKEIISYSTKDTIDIAQRLAQGLRGGEVIALTGDLGSGKTHFTKGIAQGLGIDKRVNSPTFTILHEYDCGRLKLYHFDMYRISPTELQDVGYYDAIGGQGVTVIEWAENIRECLPENTISINLAVSGENTRIITIPSLIFKP